MTASREEGRLTLPCFAPKGMEVFALTADQRFLAVEPANFLRTHFPINLQSYRSGVATTITERDLLQSLLEPAATTRVGNRVIILYGAAGSGKSELLRWLQTKISLQDDSRSKVTTRISRTDLDIFRILQILERQYDIQLLQPGTEQRWRECQQKPRTLAKILVLTALEQLFCADDQINAVYYQLIDIVQTNLELCFAAMREPSETIGTSIELFSREDLDEILHNSAVSISIEYEKLRFYLLKTFRDQLLEGLDLPQILKQVSRKVQQEQQQRPILLIDDLVQSINLFATDLLDYFITLEEGSWDIIIGITPNSLEGTKRGKELLNRITFLDTIDDRVEKLWLSDEYGLTSSFLNETNCAEYARRYLSAYKNKNGLLCNASCPAFHRCHTLDPNRSDELLAPFNEEVLVRLFRSLPTGKGKVRYFTLYLQNILERAIRGEDLPTILSQYVKSELAVHHKNQKLSQIYEFYAPILSTNDVKESQNILGVYSFFGMQVEDAEKPVIAALYRTSSPEVQSHNSSEVSSIIDADKEAIKAWLQGESVNKQQLRNVRRGVVKAIKDGYFLDIMTRLHTARPSRILRWTQTRLETIPPVSIEDVDDFEGIPVYRAIGTLAYLLHDFSDAGGWIEQELRSQILNHEAFPALFFQGVAYRSKSRSTLEKMLGMEIEELAFSLFIVVTKLNRCPVELPRSIHHQINYQELWPVQYPEPIESERPRLSTSHTGIIRRLFEDCFRLRENVYDGLLLEKMVNAIHPARALELLQKVDISKLPGDYRLNEEPLAVLLTAVQQEITKLIGIKDNPKTRDILSSICQSGLPIGDHSRQLAALLKLSDKVEKQIDNFLIGCSLFDLHRALCLAHLVDVAQYERSLQMLHNALGELQANEERISQSTKKSPITKYFLKEEIEVLIRFTQQDFRISMEQMNVTFLSKVADQLPDLYKRLELRLRG